MENIGVGMAFSDLSAERYPVEFMDLQSVRHGISRYDLIRTPPMQLPGTPISSSVSSVSSEAVTRDEKKRVEDEDEEEEKLNRNKRSKSVKSSEQTKKRVAKVSFITKSQVNNLDDGYKWRKYGQKPVRNSPFPRNYYRCTTSWCDVKKRVERCFSDPSSVITTYEGQHTHPSPLLMSKTGSPSETHFALPTLPPQLFDYNNQQQQQDLSFLGTGYSNRIENGFDDDDNVMKKSRNGDLLDWAGLVKDHGLLQDVVAAHIIKQEY